MPRVKNRGSSGCGCLPIVGLFALLVVYAAFYEKPDEVSAPVTKSETPAPLPETPSCKTDWRLCKDNADLANHNEESQKARYECKYAANDHAKYGDPKWGWFPFSTYHVGNDSPQTGIAIKFDEEAQFQNGFGAWVHIKATCQYDLVKHKVISVEIEEK